MATKNYEKLREYIKSFFKKMRGRALTSAQKGQKLHEYIKRQAAKGSEMHKYMLQKTEEYLAQGIDLNTAVKKAMSGGHIRYAMKRQKQAEAAGETEKISFFKKMRGHALTSAQKGQEISYKGLTSAQKGQEISYPKYREVKPLREVAGKKLHGKLYEIFFLEILGILCLYVPPIFMLPPLTFLALALMIFIPAYITLPCQSQVVNSLREGEYLGLRSFFTTAPVGSLTVKSIMKICAFALIIYQFFLTFTVFRLVCVAIAFLFYFSLPTRYKTSQPHKFIEAWFRMGLGVYIAFILNLTFGGFGPVVAVGTTFFTFGLAFFFTLPIHIEDEEEGIIKIPSLKSFSESKGWKYVDRFIFIFFMIASFISFLGAMGAGTSLNHIIFYAFWALSFFTGITTGPEGRPVLGIVMIFLMIFILTSSYPGYVGSAVFGYWWPQIQSFSEQFLSPLEELWSQARSGLSDSWLILTNPQQYYLMMQQKQQAQKSMPEGTKKSIEFTRFDLYTSIPGILDPFEPLVGTIELTNEGEYSSEPSMVLNFSATWTNQTSGETYTVGSLNKINCGNGKAIGGGSPIGSCEWSNTTYPKEIKLISFVFGNKDDWDILWSCENATSGESLSCDTQGATYTHSGENVKINANLTYKYKVNVSIPIEVMDYDTYMDLLINRQLEVKELTSRYTGGPVKATLYTKKQPLRTKEENLIIASVLNEGNGIIKNVNFKVRIPVDLLQQGLSSSEIYSTFDSCKVNNRNSYYEIDCSYEKDVKVNEFKRVSFFIKPKEINVDKKTFLITGFVDYEYLKTTSRSLQIANNPPQ